MSPNMFDFWPSLPSQGMLLGGCLAVVLGLIGLGIGIGYLIWK